MAEREDVTLNVVKFGVPIAIIIGAIIHPLFIKNEHQITDIENGNEDRFADQLTDSTLDSSGTIYDSALEKENTFEVAPNCNPTPTGYITNFETCADYRLVSDPRDKTKLCAEKGVYTEENMRTLYGLRRVVGEGTNREVEIIDQTTGEVIGYFPIGVDASFDAMFKPAMTDALVCLVYSNVSSD